MSRLTLFVIIDPTQEQQFALECAAEIANIAGGHIHAFCAIYEDDLSHYASKRDAKHTVKHRAMDMVDDLIKPLANDQVTVDREVIWNNHWYQAAVHACARRGAEFMIKSTHTHKRTLNLLKKRSDYYLLRHISCPVLLVQSVKPDRYQRVLATVAIDAGDDSHEKLNNLVISQARRICRITGGELHVVAAHKNRPDIVNLLGTTGDGDHETTSDEEAICSHFGIEPDKIHVATGSTKQVIVEMAKQLNAELVVMGTIARAGISGTVLGNACERVLDQLSLDVLTVH